VLAEDLLPSPALDPLGALVPADHPPSRIEHEDGVVGHAANQQPQPLLAVPQGLFQLFAFAGVPHRRHHLPGTAEPPGPQGDIDRQLAAVLPAQDDLQPRPDGSVRGMSANAARCWWWAWR
jgi:hypothetical protein